MELTFLIAIATMGGLGFLFAGGLAIADKKLRVEENPLIGKVNDALPGANCGACGKAGCYDFAVNVVDGKAEVNGCPVGGPDCAEALAKIMGVDAGSSVKMVARILCSGGHNEAALKDANYDGPTKCSAQVFVSGGNKACTYSCLGGGDCVDACNFNAIFMNENGLPEVVDELCTGCQACMKACPRNIIEMHPIDRELHVYCRNHDDPKTSKQVCKVACIGCGICARPSEGGIAIDNGLAVINHDTVNNDLIPVAKCPTKAIDFISNRRVEVIEEEIKEEVTEEKSEA
ncbi:MAG: RnfABCDGE type electron transport complex subunit B [Rhodothermaceae bacterium]